MTTHTPGPWDWMTVGASASGGFHLYIIDATKRKIAALWGKADEKTANASLIAAAPDLLEAAKELLRFNEELCAHIGLSKRYPSAEAARAAIAKANGDE